MAKQVKTNASCNAANTGAPGATPAPTKRVVPQAPDQVTFVRKPSPNGAGQNGPQAVSLNPGQSSISPLGANMKASVDDDGVLDHIIQHGTARNSDEVTSQLRSIASRNVPNHPFMRDANSGGAPSGKVPSTTQASNGKPVRQP